MPIEKEIFRKYKLDDSKKPLSLKLNDKDEEMIAIGMYMFNMHSKGGVLKELAETGLKVLLAQHGMDKFHKYTRGDRIRLIHEKPKNLRYFGKGTSENID